MTLGSITKSPLAWPAGWPRSTSRKRAKFSKSTSSYKPPAVAGGQGWTQRTASALTITEGTRRCLAELQRLGVLEGDAIISTNLELRLDGLPRSGQSEPRDPGVAVYWQRAGEAMKVMAIDIYDRVADNLGAVAATLDAMRAIERHGGSQILERTFTGFDALPPPRDCWRILGLDPKELGADAGARISQAFRDKAKTAHPDAPGGDQNAMADLSWARDEALRRVGA